MVSIGGNAVFLAPIMVLVIRGSSQAYYNVGDYGWGYLLFSGFALVVFTETAIDLSSGPLVALAGQDCRFGRSCALMVLPSGATRS
jgi:hypothetical protein